MENQKTSPVSEPLRGRIDGLADTLQEHLDEQNPQIWDAVIASAHALLEEAIAASDDVAANHAWFVHKIATARRAYVGCIEQLRNEKYYEGWCELERIEISLHALQRNPFYDCQSFGVQALSDLVANWQALFPYRIFASPEFAIRQQVCSICGHTNDPWSSCTHQTGRVYGGKECYRIVKDVELLGISLVRDPVQKYSVLGINIDPDGKSVDTYNYGPIKFVLDRISSPFSAWRVVRTYARHPHSLFKDRAHDGPCPCESGRLYRDCCLSQVGVVRPHFDISFSELPPAHLPAVEFLGYRTTQA
jgi:hypothetical protein